MQYKQLVTPNFSTVGQVGYCLQYARECFGAPAVEPNAWTAWLNTQFKHEDADLPTDVSIPMWYSYEENGEQLGHVTINVPGVGIYSSPWEQGTTHAVLPSIAEVERIYGVEYVGWSEDISKVRVIEGGDMPLTHDQVAKISVGFCDLQPEVSPAFMNNIGLELDAVLDNFLNYTESKSLRLDAEAYRAEKANPAPAEPAPAPATEPATPDVTTAPVTAPTQNVLAKLWALVVKSIIG